MHNIQQWHVQDMQSASIADVPLSHFWNLLGNLTSRVSELEKTATQGKVSKEYERDLTLRELAHELNKSYSTVWRMVRKRRLIPVDNSSRILRFRRKDVEDFKKSVTW
jgi:predicted DNA-binding transcriptional regulator AlpA